MKNIVYILGSNGFIGNSLVQKFISKGFFVIGLGRSKISRQINEKYIKNSNFHYFSIGNKNILNIKSQLKNYANKSTMNSIFINSAWQGKKSLSDGDLSSQIKNVYLSNDAINLATEIGCQKFLQIGSILENYIDIFIANNWYKSEYNFETQLDYSLAKNICRDFNKIVSYLNKIDYIHCTFSIFIDPELSGKGYIPSTLKRIAKGLKYNKPNNNELFDITLIDEGSEAIYLLSQKAKINKTYFIGTSFPKNLNQIFQTFEEAKYKRTLRLEDLDNLSNKNLFNIDNLIKDIGYKPKKIFNEFALDYFKK